MRALVGLLPDAAAEAGVSVALVRDVGHLVRAQLEAPDGNRLEVDVVHEPVADISAPPPPLEGIVIESLPDLRASKLTCILSRSEPRDLVDLYFLDQAGFPPERDLEIALRGSRFHGRRASSHLRPTVSSQHPIRLARQDRRRDPRCACVV
jgi:Nucleotidyl transferase AbiEii toxin, Type IV TA system